MQEGDEKVGEDNAPHDPTQGFEDIDPTNGGRFISDEMNIGPAAKGEHGPINQAQGSQDQEG